VHGRLRACACAWQIEGMLDMEELTQDELKDIAMPHVKLKCSPQGPFGKLFEQVVKKALWMQLKAEMQAFIEQGKGRWR